MFEFYLIPMGFRMGTQNCTSKFHSLSNWIPIYTWDTSMNLWLNSLLFYIQIFILKGGPSFDPFSSSNFV